jgi:hypothetical protein
MDEYKLFLSHINQMIDRRQSVTTTYLSVNTVIIGGLALLFQDFQSLTAAQQVSVEALALAGVIACGLWRRLVAQYNVLLEWWYRQMRGLEENMPDSHKLLSREYDELYQPERAKVNIGLSRHEMRLTWLLTALYLAFVLAVFVAKWL